ncbi:major facilitator superfamily domain-containing protein [Mycena floridula]|nr:major facilitator superfamily domain-containing protein [Mycena floridula]
MLFHRTTTTSVSRDDEHIDHDELKLPKMSSLVIIILANFFMQTSFFIIVSSSNEYAKHLGGSATFSGVVIGVPTVFSGLALIPLLRYDGGNYRLPLHVCCASCILGMVLYGSAYKVNWLYLILIGRCVNGLGFAMFMYCKRYCTDPRIVGVRRRTTLASWLVMGQGLGMTVGPFAGGLLYKVGFKNSIFNGFTSPAWTMALIWVIFWGMVTVYYEDPPSETSRFALSQPTPNALIPTSESTTSTGVSYQSSVPILTAETNPVPVKDISKIWGTSACMCWFAMTCFFILGAWEANLPVFGASFDKFHWSPFAAGNFIALGGITTFPFLIINLFVARRVQDRKILAFGTGLGAAALLAFLSLLETHHLNYVGAFFCWWAVALGFNVASTVTLSLLSKQLPANWNAWSSLAIQYSNFTGRVTGAVWGGSGVLIGMPKYVGLEIAFVGVGAVLFTSFWRDLKAKTG